ncbi:MAG: NAD(P)-dependent alcohol dehydrogenase [Thermoplasmata archaeon]
MKAIVCTRYGAPEVLQLKEVEKPTPKSAEVLIRIRAASVTAVDCELRGTKLPLLQQLHLRVGCGFRRPRRGILGQELAGEIEAVGQDVKFFEKGDQVFAATGFGLGGNAEFVCLPEDGIVATKPSNMSCEEAGIVSVAGLEALLFLRAAKGQRGERMLTSGAGGSIGTFAVPIAITLDADMTGVDTSAKLETIRSVGADEARDFTIEDDTKSGETYDVILGVMGMSPFSGCIGASRENGRYLLGNPRLSQVAGGRWTSMTSSKSVTSGAARRKVEDLNDLKELIEAGKFRTVIDRSYSREDTAAAHRYIETGNKKGNVAVIVD